MRICTHVEWVRRQDGRLEDTGRLDRITNEELVSSFKQYPQLVHFLGSRAKNQAIREIFPCSRRRRKTGAINLRLEASSAISDHPLLFSDANPFIETKRSIDHGCHEETAFVSNLSFDALHSRVIFLFSDVVCMFADDFSTLAAVVERVRTWANIGSSSSLQAAVHPYLIIATSRTEIVAEFWSKLRLINDSKLKATFCAVKLLHLVELPSQYRHLKEEIKECIQQMRLVRLQNRCLFTASHLTSFFHQALKQISADASATFNFVEAGRFGNPLSQNFPWYLQIFLELIKPFQPKYDELSPFVASSLLADAYPPGSHYFAAESVFRSLYRDFCLASFRDFYGEDTAIQLCSSIEADLAGMLQWIEHGNITAARYHSETIQSQQLWRFIKSNRVCFCLFRAPERKFRCGHSICDICVRRDGKRDLIHESRYELKECRVCKSTGTLTVDLKPKSAGVRVLAIDGGGSRAVIPIRYLCGLENALHSVSLHEMFDLVSATSSGGLVAFCIFLRKHTAAYCSETLKNIARRCFSRTTLRRLMSVVFTRAMYSEIGLEQCLKAELGDDDHLFGYVELSGARIAVTGLRDGSRSIMANYNGVTPLEPDCGYDLVRPADIREEPLVWEAGRATSAAPIYFKPMKMAAGRFVDGGLGFPNPAEIASWERRRLWPEVDEVDVSLSLGTGTVKPEISSSKHSNNPILDLLNSFMSFLDAEVTWRSFENSLQKNIKDDYLRFNPELLELFGLDTVDGIPSLIQSVEEQLDVKALSETAYRLLASNFYFVLDACQFQNGFYLCTGKIRCRADIKRTKDALSYIEANGLSFVTRTEMLGIFQLNRDICRCCQRYAKSVQFYVRSPNERIAISLRSERGTQKLSGFPQNMSWFMEVQGLYSPFGTPDHDDLKRNRCSVCEFNWHKRRSSLISAHTKRRRI